MKYLQRHAQVAPTRSRDHRMYVAIIVCLLLPYVSGAFAHPDGAEDQVIQARSIQLVDDEGKVRAEIGFDDDGAAGLFLRDPAGRTRASFIHEEQQTGVFIMDETETTRVGAVQFAHGGGGFALHGADSKGASVLYHKDKGSLAFYDESGEVTAKFPENK